MKISTGFLTGNLLLNAETGVNECATAKRFAEKLASAIASHYHGVEVIVGWRRGSGFLPQELWTAVDYDPGHEEVEVINRIVGETIRKGGFYICGGDGSEFPASGTACAGSAPDSRISPVFLPLDRGVSPVSTPRIFSSEKGFMETLKEWMKEKVSHS